MSARVCSSCFSFFFNDTATTEIYTLSLHDALPIYANDPGREIHHPRFSRRVDLVRVDRKSTRLNSSHANISYAGFCLKKKNKSTTPTSSFANSSPLNSPPQKETTQ